MIKKYYLFLLGFSSSLITNAQQIVTTSGGNMVNNSVEINWTIGETITETVINSNTAVTSGLNQPILKISTLVKKIKNEMIASIFPNPTFQNINIRYNGQLPIRVKIISPKGTILSTVNLKEQTTQLDLSRYTNGVYIIEMTDNSGKKNIYRIVKQ